MAVPYLTAPPELIHIDVGRQLFVDDFLIATSTLQRVFGMPEKYTGNPVLRPETELELNGIRNAAAVPKGGGLWWIPTNGCSSSGMRRLDPHHLLRHQHKRSALGAPKLDVVPDTNQVLPPDLTPDSGPWCPIGRRLIRCSAINVYARPAGQCPGEYDFGGWHSLRIVLLATPAIVAPCSIIHSGANGSTAVERLARTVTRL